MGEFVGYVAREIGSALILRPHLSTTLRQLEAVSITLALLVGVSMLAGQGAMLAVNKVRGPSYLILLLSLGLRIIAMGLFLAGLMWLLGEVMAIPVGFATLVHAVLLAASPGLFAFLALAPGIGPFLGRVLAVWAFVILWNITAEAFGVPLALAFVISLTAVVVTLAVFTVLARPAGRLQERLWRRATGRPLRRSSRELLAIEGLLEHE